MYVTAIILAAGTSSRMGRDNKLLLNYKNNTFIETVLQQLIQSRVDEIILVVGYEKERIKKLILNDDIKIVENENFQQGMTTSIKKGVASASKNTDGYLICLSDMPLLTTVDYNKIIKNVTETKEILIPVYQNKKGNPVYFSSHFKEDILKNKQMEGCKNVVGQHKKFVRKIFFENTHILQDVDTKTDYIRLKD